MESNAYYYERLNKQQKQVYHGILNGLQALVPSFPVPRLSGRELADIYFMVRMDHPEVFYTTKFSYRFYEGADTVELVPEYLFKKKQIQEHQKAMGARIAKLVRPAASLNEWEKELYVHDFICHNVRYDKLKKPYSHEIIGPLGQGVGVCEGIAKTVKILCDHLGIWCIIALSDNNPEKKIKYRHMWNIIRVNGQYYHLDATFDNSLCDEENVRYDYFNLCDAQIFRDHEPVIYPVPACTDNGHFFYKEKKLSFTKMEDVQKRAAQAAKKNRTLILHWRGGYLTREILQELLSLVGEEAAKKNKYALLSLNWPQAVLKLTFKDEAPAENVVAEEANEGEQIDIDE